MTPPSTKSAETEQQQALAEEVRKLSDNVGKLVVYVEGLVKAVDQLEGKVFKGNGSPTVFDRLTRLESVVTQNASAVQSIKASGSEAFKNRIAVIAIVISTLSAAAAWAKVAFT